MGKDMRTLISALSCNISPHIGPRADMKVLISAPHFVHKNVKIVVLSSKSTDAQGGFRPRQIIQRAEGWYGMGGPIWGLIWEPSYWPSGWYGGWYGMRGPIWGFSYQPPISALSCHISPHICLRADMRILISAPISAFSCHISPHIVHKNIKIVVLSSKSTVPAGDLDLEK